MFLPLFSVQWVRLENSLILIGSSRLRNYSESEEFCRSVGDGATLFDPIDYKIGSKLMDELGLTDTDWDRLELWTAAGSPYEYVQFL